MSSLRLRLMVAVAIVAAFSSIQPASAAPAASAPQPSQLALDLARTMQPAEVILALSDRVIHQTVAELFKSDNEFAALEQKHPGLKASMGELMASANRRHESAKMPALHRRYAALYESMFLPDEMAEMKAFYGSALGRKLLESKIANFNAMPFIDEFAADPDAPIARATMNNANQQASEAAVKGLNEAEVEAITKAMRPSTLLKLKLAGPSIVKFETDLANEQDPEFDKLMEEAAAEAMKKHGL